MSVFKFISKQQVIAFLTVIREKSRGDFASFEADNEIIQHQLENFMELQRGYLQNLMKEDFIKVIGQILGLGGYASQNRQPEVQEIEIYNPITGKNERKKVIDLNDKDFVSFAAWDQLKFILFNLYFLIERYIQLQKDTNIASLPTELSILSKALVHEIWITSNAYMIRKIYGNILKKREGFKENDEIRDLCIKELLLFTSSFLGTIRDLIDEINEFEFCFPCGSISHAVYLNFIYTKKSDDLLIRVDDSSNSEPVVFGNIALKDEDMFKALSNYLCNVCLALDERNHAAMGIINNDYEDFLLQQLQNTGYISRQIQKAPNCVVEGFLRGMWYRLFKLKNTEEDQLFQWLYTHMRRHAVVAHVIPDAYTKQCNLRDNMFNLVDGVELLFASKNRATNITMNHPQLSVHMTPDENIGFIGRIDELQQINDMFNSSGINKIIISGIGGIGKSQLAKKYALSHKDKYGIICWIDASQDIDTQLVELAYECIPEIIKNIIESDKTKKYDKITAALKKFLKETTNNWLLIFDNVTTSWKTVNKYMPSSLPGNTKHIIITSRDSRNKNCIKLKEFDLKTAVQYIQNSTTGILIEDAEKLAETLGCLALALTQASAFFRAYPRTDRSLQVKEYISNFEKRRQALWEKEKEILQDETIDHETHDGYNLTIKTSIQISIVEIKKNLSASRLLNALSLLHNINIPQFIIMEWLKDITTINREELNLEFDKIISTLNSQSILDEKDKSLFCMHSMVQKVNIDSEIKPLMLAEKVNLVTVLVKIISLFFGYSQSDKVKIKNLELLLSHVHKLLKNCTDELEIDQEPLQNIGDIAELYYTLGNYYLHRRWEYVKALTSFNNAIKFCKYGQLKVKIDRQLAKARLKLKKNDEVEVFYKDFLEKIDKKVKSGDILDLDEIDLLCDIGSFYSKTNPRYDYKYMSKGEQHSVNLYSVSKNHVDNTKALHCFELALKNIVFIKNFKVLEKKKGMILSYIGEYHLFRSKKIKLHKFTAKYIIEHLQNALSHFEEAKKLLENNYSENRQLLANLMYNIGYAHFEISTIQLKFKDVVLSAEPDLPLAIKYIEESIKLYTDIFRSNTTVKALGYYTIRGYTLLEKIYSFKGNRDEQTKYAVLIKTIKSNGAQKRKRSFYEGEPSSVVDDSDEQLISQRNREATSNQPFENHSQRDLLSTGRKRKSDEHSHLSTKSSDNDSSQTQPNKKQSLEKLQIRTIADGNCAFNAIVLGICDLLEANLLPVNAYFDRELADGLNILDKTRSSILTWLIDKNSNEFRQNNMQLILRKIVFDYIEQHYTTVYQSVYKELLWTAYQRFINFKEEDDIFCAHPVILKIFQTQQNLSHAALIEWWNHDMKNMYFSSLRQSARHSLDKERWGSEVEIDAFATILGINIRWKKQYTDVGQQLGIGGGLIDELSDLQMRYLTDLGIGIKYHGKFRIHNFETRLTLEARLNSLPQKEVILDILKNTSDQNIFFPAILPQVENFNLLCQELIERNIITKENAITYRFITFEEKINREEIHKRLNGLQDLNLRNIILNGFKENVPEFGVLHQGNHWSYLQPNSITAQKKTNGTIINQRLSKTQTSTFQNPSKYNPTIFGKPSAKLSKTLDILIEEISENSPESAQSNDVSYYEKMNAELKLLGSLALADSCGTTTQLIRYLNKMTEQNEDVFICDHEWNLSPSQEEQEINLQDINFPFQTFFHDFILLAKKRKFIITLLLNQAHFTGLIFVKDEQSGTQTKILAQYFNPTGTNPPLAGEDKEALVRINNTIQQIIGNINKLRQLSLGSEYSTEQLGKISSAQVELIKLKYPLALKSDAIPIEILSDKQQINGSDCAYIVGQTLVEIALNISCSIKKFNMADKETSVKAIAKARANFCDPKIVGTDFAKAILRDQLFSRLGKALTENDKYAKEIRDFVNNLSDDCGLNLLILNELKVFIKRYDKVKGGLDKIPGLLSVDKAITYLSSSQLLKSLENKDLKYFCDELLEPYHPENGDIIFQLNKLIKNRFLSELSVNQSETNRPVPH